MKHLQIFETGDAFEAAKANLEKPWVVLTEDDKNVHIMESGEPTPTYEYVDLGLPSGLKWAKCNVGATSETDYGLYFQWGATEGYTAEQIENGEKVFDWANYKYCNGSSTTMTKYCTDKAYGKVDDKSQLDAEDDAAIQNLRSQPGHENARMPKTDEYITLRNETIWVWSPGGKVGVKSGTSTIDYVDYPAGYFVFKVKSESDKGAMGTFTKDADGNLVGFTAQSGTLYYPGAHSVSEGVIEDGDTHIFFPASGYASGTGVIDRGSYGYYWSSSLYTSYSDYGRHLYFNSGLIGPQNVYSRYYGFCVRSVSEN